MRTNSLFAPAPQLFLQKKDTKTTRVAAQTTSRNMVKWPDIFPTKTSTEQYIQIGKNIGFGSYGTVHLCAFLDDDSSSKNPKKNVQQNIMIAKRAWTEEELPQGTYASSSCSKEDGNKSHNQESDKQSLQERANRCAQYLQVERHCFEKMQTRNKEQNNSSKGRSSQVPEYIETFPDIQGREWVVVSFIGRASSTSNSTTNNPNDTADPKPAVNLADVIYTDWVKQHSDDRAKNHHLSIVQRELGLSPEATFADTLDVVFRSLLSVIAQVHRSNIVHRDLKPANLLLDPATSSLVLIDFGSAADMDPVSASSSFFSSMGIGNGGRVGLDTGSVALSPIYAAPEMFIRWDRSPLSFDVFSGALIFCQLLFNLLDDRTDAAFHQQLEDCGYDLDAWLSREMASTVRPAGLNGGLEYLAERPGLWGILKAMLVADPERRLTSQAALDSFIDVLKGEEGSDGPFFKAIVASSEFCGVTFDDERNVDIVEFMPTRLTEGAMVMPRPLHFVATFDRSKSLGLILSEADGDDDEEEEKESRETWKKVVASAVPGEVFVRGFTPRGQAEQMGIFEIGDRLVGVGEIPLFGGGFDKAVEMVRLSFT